MIPSFPPEPRSTSASRELASTAREFPTTAPGLPLCSRSRAALQAAKIPPATPIRFHRQRGRRGRRRLARHAPHFRQPPLEGFYAAQPGARWRRLRHHRRRGLWAAAAFEVIVRGPGGHSWSDFGAPNPIVVLARAIHAFSQTRFPPRPRRLSISASSAAALR